MSGRNVVGRLVVIGSCIALSVSGCAFQGLNSLPLPGAVGRNTGSAVYHVEVANVGTLEPNSPVMIDEVVVGSVSTMSVKNWHADVEVSVKPGVIVPANVMASVGQTSLLGSMHLALNPPVGERPVGRLEPGATIALNRSSTYPSTEQTLSSLSAVVNGGGLGQIGDIIHNFNAGLNGREPEVRELLTRLNDFVGVLDAQRDNMIASIEALNRLAATFAGRRDVIDQALKQIPPALDVLIKDRPRITTALEKLGTFSATLNQLIDDTQADLVKNLQNLEPTLQALADVGPDLDLALGLATTYPYGQRFIDRAIKGDYANMFAVMDFTVARLKSSLFLGTRWGEEGAQLVPAPGDPWYMNYSYDPMGAAVADPPPPPQAGIVTPVVEPVLPVAPPPPLPGVAATTPGGASTPIFAGPYGGNG
ncbi:MCE family protein [Mycobacterium sp. AZCC_0083]|uniref:MCE family protein n=1 Tax=Mycobacterium sp. AZCC_0083 TaxID=2735882 RepID=UPI00160CE27C|nr:MCE family protein [Mycobacterium sp. AZCC_0083]MBB5166422.1 virulence factor Mce-like protein [Mycobacterium sp. AZCC_0083]